ncbi:MAG: SagB/ThcOx family dehydrogenase, partial [Thiohalorhabdaceae bacterium]
RQAPAVLVITGIYHRTTGKYGDRGRRYVHIETGHAGQNVYLQAEALDLGTVMVGAFSDDRVARVLDLGKKAVPLALMPVGRPR